MNNVFNYLDNNHILFITHCKDLFSVKFIQYCKRLLGKKPLTIDFDQFNENIVNFIQLCQYKYIIINAIDASESSLNKIMDKIERNCIIITLCGEKLKFNNIYSIDIPDFMGFNNHSSQIEYYGKSNRYILIDYIIEEIINNINNLELINFSNLNTNPIVATRQQYCSLRLLYQGKPDDFILDRNVGEFRINLGKKLFYCIEKSILENIDYIVPIPSSGIFYAVGLSIISKIPVMPIANKLNISERAFEIQNIDSRKRNLYNNIQVNSHLIKNKNILLIDEAIFTGATLKVFCDILKNTAVKDIHIAIPSPKCYNECDYLVQPKRELLLNKLQDDHLSYYFGVQSVSFLNLEDYEDELRSIDNICIECFKSKTIK